MSTAPEPIPAEPRRRLQFSLSDLFAMIAAMFGVLLLVDNVAFEFEAVAVQATVAGVLLVSGVALLSA